MPRTSATDDLTPATNCPITETRNDCLQDEDYVLLSVASRCLSVRLSVFLLVWLIQTVTYYEISYSGMTGVDLKGLNRCWPEGHRIR